MIDRLQELYLSLEAGKDRMLAELERWTPEQRQFRPTAGAWSALQVAQHVVAAEARSVDVMIKLHGRPSGKRSLPQRLFKVLVWVVLKLGIKVKNPTDLADPDGKTTPEEIRRDWDRLRARLSDHLEGLAASDLALAGFKHPVSGPLNLEEGLVFLVRHIRHHLRQLERLRQEPDFPR